LFDLLRVESSGDKSVEEEEEVFVDDVVIAYHHMRASPHFLQKTRNSSTPKEQNY